MDEFAATTGGVLELLAKLLVFLLQLFQAPLQRGFLLLKPRDRLYSCEVDALVVAEPLDFSQLLHVLLGVAPATAARAARAAAS